MVAGLHHVALSTPDLERCLSFYCGALGGKQVSEVNSWNKGNVIADRMTRLKDSAARYAFVSVGNVFLEIFEFSSLTPNDQSHRACDYGLVHLSFVVDDIHAEYARLKAAGMEFNGSPVEFEDGSIFTYGRDPDGNIIELLGDPDRCEYSDNSGNSGLVRAPSYQVTPIHG